MKGKVLDWTLIVAVAAVFFVVAAVHPGVWNLVVAWVGVMGLGYYNSFVRHDPSRGRGEVGRQAPAPPHETLRPAWR